VSGRSSGRDPGAARRGSHVLGIDVGGTKLRAAIADGAGAVIAETTEPTDGREAGRLVAQVRRVAEDLERRTGAQVAAVGIALPVVVDPSGGPATSVHNVPGLAGIDVGAALRAAFPVPVASDNDVTLATLAEWRRGAGVGRRDFAVLAIGTGIGMGIVAAGTIVRGAHGAAGEVGFLPFGADPADPASRTCGAFEVAAAGPGLRRRIHAAAASGGSFPADADLDAVAAAAEAGDDVARAVLDHEARLLATGIAAVGAVLDPELVILGGGVGSSRRLLAPVRRELAAAMARPPAIATSALGDRGPLVGAIELALDTAFGRVTAPPGR
jgi:glucokinase